MLGWMLKRGLEGRDAPGDSDDTQFEQPDTPGPVFAARAFKSAIFGTPARLENNSSIWSEADKKTEAKAPELSGAASASSTVAANGQSDEKDTNISKDVKDTKDTEGTKDEEDDGAVQATPGRLPGILLTPGTGTSRRKRVSFGNDVEDKEDGRKKEFRIDRDHRNRPNLFGDPKPATSRDRARHRPRSKLVEALENSRRQNAETGRTEVSEKTDEKEEKQERRSRSQREEQKAHKYPPKPTAMDGVEEDEALWEEVDDAEWDPDVTVDLNEPHSQSGRYWKAQFQRYQEDAKVEMSKLLKYKQLAKSYAKMKDAESVDLHAKLQEEKGKVTKMEGRITDLANQIARKRMKGTTDRDYQGLISDLTRQTALAVQYRNQVKELEAMLNDDWSGDLSQQQEALDEEVTTGHVSRRWHQHPATSKVTSPRTHKTLMDTQRELRRARDQVKELALVKDEVKRLRTALREAEQQVRKGESGNKTMSADLAAAEATAEASKAKAEDLEKRAKFAEDERRRKDEELRLLQHKYDALKDDAKARVGEAEQVLRRKNEQIAELKKEVRQATKQAQTAKEQLAAAQAAQTAHAARASQAASNADHFAAAVAETNEPVLPEREAPARRRYESLRSKRTERLGARPQPRRSQPEAMEDFAIKLDDLRLEPLGGTALPEQHMPPVDIHEDVVTHNNQDDTSNFQLPPLLRKSKSTVRLRAKSKLAEGGDVKEANRVDDIVSLRRRRGTEALRTIESHQNLGEADKLAAAGSALTKVGSLRTRRPLSVPMAAGAEEPKIDLIGSRFARLGETTTEIQQPQQPQQQQQQVMDSSRLSLSSERAAAAVARIEKRRAERRKALDAARNKENVLPLI